jgi:peptidoglycan/LPS O-acetylase OafA/YrhL
MPGAFRLLLASAVVVNHHTRLKIGAASVELFFILSGYWIDRMYGGRYSKLRRRAAVFVASRLMRLLPMFQLFSAIAMVLAITFHTPAAPQGLSLALLPNFTILGYASMPEQPLVPAWSLDIELQFYLLFPLLWLVMVRIDAVLGYVTAILLVAGGLYLGLVLKDQSAIVFPYLGFFFLGVFASRKAWKPSTALIWAGVLGAMALVVFTLAMPEARGILIAADGLPGRSWNTAVNIVLAVLIAPLAISTVTRPSTRIDRIAGDLSYVVYCSHWVGVVIAGAYLADLRLPARLPFIAFDIAVTYAVSLALLLWVDRPLGQFRAAWIGRQP